MNKAVAFAPENRAEHSCSFCGYPESHVVFLIASEGTGAAICDGCLDLAVAAAGKFGAAHGKRGAGDV